MGGSEGDEKEMETRGKREEEEEKEERCGVMGRAGRLST